MTLHDRLCDAVDLILYGPDSLKANAEHADELLDVVNPELEARDKEIERLTRALRLSEARIGGAARYVDQADARSQMLENAMAAYEGIADECDRYRLAWLSARARATRAKRNRASELRWANGMWSDALHDRHRYRLAWLSARRRAADEANLGMEAVEHLQAEVTRLKRLLAEGGRSA